MTVTQEIECQHPKCIRDATGTCGGPCRTAALSARPAVAVPDGWVLESGQAFANQVRAIVYKLHGQSYSSTVSALNRFDADLSRARAMLAAAHQPAPQPVAVKPLEWEEPSSANNHLPLARSVFGDYYISVDGGRHYAHLEAHVKPYDNLLNDEAVGDVFAAQAIAEADYQHRMSVLLTTPPADREENERLRQRVKALEEDMSEIARQKLPVEMTAEQKNYADFEGGYAACVDKARAALKGGEAND